MNIASGSIHRPVLTTIVFLIIITLGVVSFMRLSIDLMPEITYPTISVITSYENVGPQEMEELVTRPLEESLSAVQGVEEITSTSTEGRSSIRVSFTWGYDLDVAANDIRDRIDRQHGRRVIPLLLDKLPDLGRRPCRQLDHRWNAGFDERVGIGFIVGGFGRRLIPPVAGALIDGLRMDRQDRQEHRHDEEGEADHSSFSMRFSRSISTGP